MRGDSGRVRGHRRRRLQALLLQLQLALLAAQQRLVHRLQRRHLERLQMGRQGRQGREG
jgi:hypothetical protein